MWLHVLESVMDWLYISGVPCPTRTPSIIHWIHWVYEIYARSIVVQDHKHILQMRNDIHTHTLLTSFLLE